jgi:general secretion pathway protein N
VKVKPVLWVCLLIVFFVSAIVHLPASVVVRWVSIPENLELQGVSGTFWQGQISTVNVDSVSLGKWQWQIKPSQLLKGKVVADLRFGEQSSIQMRGKSLIVLSRSSLRLEQLSLQMPAAELTPWITVPLLTDLAGDVSLFIEEYQYDGEPYCSTLNGKADWHNAVFSIMSTPLYLEEMTAFLSCEKHQVVGEMEQQSKSVSSQIRVGLTSPNRFALSGWFSPNSAFPDSFVPSLAWLPGPDSKNRYQIKHNGRW